MIPMFISLPVGASRCMVRRVSAIDTVILAESRLRAEVHKKQAREKLQQHLSYAIIYSPVRAC